MTETVTLEPNCMHQGDQNLLEKGQQGKEHAKAHEEPLLGVKSGLQGVNQNSEGKAKEGTKASQKA